MANYTFSSKLRGYDKNEVDTYIDKLQKEFAEVCAHLQGKVKSLESTLGDQDDIAKAMIQVQAFVRQTEEDAKSEAETIINKSQTKAKQILSNAKSEANKILYDTNAKAAEILNSAETAANNLTLIAEAKADRIIKQINSSRDEVRDEMKKIFNISSLFLKEIDSEEPTTVDNNIVIELAGRETDDDKHDINEIKNDADIENEVDELINSVNF